MNFKKILLTSLLIMTFILNPINLSATEIYASSVIDEQIDIVVKEELSKAKIPNAITSTIKGDNAEYLYFPDINNKQKLNIDSLFQIGSVSKAYTGLGILLLEDKGLLSLDDPVSKHLPWFTVLYEGKTVPPNEFTIANLLYQTSGFTNSESKYPRANSGISLEEKVRQLNRSELTFYPSQQFSYANTNFYILGLIIETVSKQSYDTFMTENILLPLGLKNTYTDPQKAKNTGNVVEGSRISFFQTQDYDASVAVANVPAGYIYSNIGDMSRWLQIQMGEIHVSEQFQRIIKKSHNPNPTSVVDNNTHYAAGWFINDKTGEIYHSGATPNYSANVSIRPQSNIATCVLTNMNASANTNSIAANILNIMESKPVTNYKADVWIIFDMIFSSVTIIGILIILFLLIITLWLVRQIHSGNRIKMKLSKKSILYFIPSFIVTLLTVLSAIIIPISFEGTWMNIGIWAPFSLFSGMVLLILLSVYSFIISFMLITYKKSKSY